MTPQYRTLALASLTLLALAGCKQEVQPVEEIRPVRYVVAGSDSAGNSRQFSGEIRARHESQLAFRVAGKIMERRVNAGDSVKKGQVLALLDASDYRLDTAAKQAQLSAAQAELGQQEADLKRSRELLAQNFISSAQVERQQTTVNAARASLQQAQAALSASRNQGSYTALLADSDGVIGSISAEPGMVVAAGQAVARLAANGEREVAFQVPENAVAAVRQASGFKVKLWADGRELDARLRELSADADSATRTYAARLTLPQADSNVRLGMTASVRAQLAGQGSTLRLPLAAMLDTQGKHYVWVINGQQQVGRKAVEVGDIDGDSIAITRGLAGGEKVVTAGVHLLRDGQHITLLQQ
ncbi:efflux RND transporter periplasmic adaptor subunit [Vogesella sp. LIG4]|uniref:efflux RND transporter periplasmic adaptor subunit n=1 Tax=Vogesella sp. LIG4 TaxID=1192162 RepID=UPI00081FE91C|nr:efflux RND transporter periplasmic adaptor subunit [Vogesella sp. LIG4]SCK16171.1 RND family efflux transporter, MFP subunit [Vogesella sp. LIG4]